MKFEDFLKAIEECMEEGWKDSDIPREAEIFFEVLYEHVKTCRECREQLKSWFEDEESETLLQFVSRWFFTPCSFGIAPEDWLCEKGVEEVERRWKEEGL